MPHTFLYVSAAMLGAVFGSFLNVLALRDDKRMTVFTGRSACPHCHKELRWFELIPVLSFLWQSGRCLRCKMPLSWRYPLVELLTAGLAVFSVGYGYLERGSWPLAVGIFAALACLLVMSLTDLATMEVRPEYATAAAVFGGSAQYVTHQITAQDLLLGVLVGGGSIALLSYLWKLLTGRMGMGEGDVWIAAAVGALVGYPVIIPALFLAVMTGAVVGVFIASRQSRGLAIEMPFGPFLALGALLALAWGQGLLDWYIL